MNPTVVLDRLLPLLDWLVRTTWQSAALIVAVALLQAALGRWLAPRWRCAMWLIVVTRLAMPMAPASPMSMFNLAAMPEPRVSSDWVQSVTLGPVPSFDLAANGPVIEPPRATDKDVRRWGLAHVLVLIWLSGLGAYGLVVAAASVRGRRKLRGASACDNAAILDLLITCRKQMGVRRRVRLVETDAVASPALCGVFRPTILLPVGMTDSLGPAGLRWVLLHELGHVRRWDVAVNHVIIALRAVHWFNPLVWLAFHRMRGDREMACDALVLESAKEADPREYGRTIVRVLESAIRPRGFMPAVAMAEGVGQLQRRLKMIARNRRPTWSASFFAIVLIAIVGCAGLTDKSASPGGRSVERTRAAETSTLEDLNRGACVVTYDINDLLHEVRDFGFEDEESGRQSHARTRDQLLADVIRLIQETVDPESWRANGGVVGSITEHGGALVVTTTDKNHRQIRGLLGQLHEQRAIMIRCETRLVLADPAQVDGLDATIDPLKPKAKAGAAYLSDEQVESLLHAPGSDSPATPRLTAFNGQKALVSVLKLTNYVANVEHSERDGKPAWDVDVRTLESGLKVELQGTVSADRRYVIMTIRPKFLHLQDLRSRPHPDSTPEQPVILEEPVVEKLEAHMTVSIPDRGALMLVLGKVTQATPAVAAANLVPGSTRGKAPLVNSLTANLAISRKQRTVVLLVKPMIVMNRQKEEELFPGSGDASPPPGEALSIHDKDVKFAGLLREAGELCSQLKYEEALSAIDRALVLEPDNVPAQAMKEMLEASIIKRIAHERRRSS